MYKNAQGGNDVLAGGAGTTNSLSGDAYNMFDSTRGGNDVLTGGTGLFRNVLVGDAIAMSGTAVGGNDVLISNTGDDHMWGDAMFISGSGVTTGTDTFVFSLGNGADDINDFRQSDGDQIDVRAYGFADFAALSVAISDVGADTLIDFGGGNQVTLVGFADSSLLTAGDFILA